MPRQGSLTKKSILPLDSENLLKAYIERSREATVGAFVKGVIHNLNGGIQILGMQMELLQRMLSKEKGRINPAILDQLDRGMEQIDRFRNLIEELRHIEAHLDQEEPKMVDLNDLFDELLVLLRNNLFLKHQVRVEKFLAHPLPPLKGYYFDFCQSFLNLILNALEAMENSPVKILTIITEKREEGLQVTVKDTGCGILEEIRPRLFTPFFTTKGGRHKGLGLFVARELLVKYGASLNYFSQKGETAFKVLFPLFPS